MFAKNGEQTSELNSFIKELSELKAKCQKPINFMNKVTIPFGTLLLVFASVSCLMDFSAENSVPVVQRIVTLWSTTTAFVLAVAASDVYGVKTSIFFRDVFKRQNIKDFYEEIDQEVGDLLNEKKN